MATNESQQQCFCISLIKMVFLFADGNKLIDDHTLVALTIMIAESKPDEKEMMISVVFADRQDFGS